ncbi:hypothetical protein HaLaN_18440 [Haematococcus lacustris]|uniref:Uncharacterized protein n=1 Tax=Haematococcus lacustris TaxID=44745 RepID=A0A699ZNL0_HAELA|nr:hypothetical protein HaLaN_18440 [Haematococcus lacustris]
MADGGFCICLEIMKGGHGGVARAAPASWQLVWTKSRGSAGAACWDDVDLGCAPAPTRSPDLAQQAGSGPLHLPHRPLLLAAAG